MITTTLSTGDTTKVSVKILHHQTASAQVMLFKNFPTLVNSKVASFGMMEIFLANGAHFLSNSGGINGCQIDTRVDHLIQRTKSLGGVTFKTSQRQAILFVFNARLN